MKKLLKRQDYDINIGYFKIESLRANDNAFFWRITIYKKLYKWFGFSFEYKEIKRIDYGDRDYALKQFSDLSFKYDAIELISDTRI